MNNSDIKNNIFKLIKTVKMKREINGYDPLRSMVLFFVLMAQTSKRRYYILSIINHIHGDISIRFKNGTHTLKIAEKTFQATEAEGGRSKIHTNVLSEFIKSRINQE